MPNIKNLQTRFYKVRAVLSAAALIALVGGATIVHADQYDDQINNLSQQNSKNQSIVKGLAAQAGSYQEAISQLQIQIAALQAVLDTNLANQAALQQQITDAQNKITLQKQYLSQDIAVMYTDGQLSTIEQLATSKNLSDYVDKQEYRIVAQNKINDTIKQIAALQAEMQKQKVALDQLIASQKQQNDQLAADKAQQDQLLALNEDQQASYAQQVQANNNQISQLRATQRAAYQRAFGGGGSSSTGSSVVYRNMTGQTACAGGYPSQWCGTQDTVFDNWRLYNRECVSFAAWYESAHGHYVPSFGSYNGAARGNANQWESVLRDSGAATIIGGSDVSSSSSVIGDVVYMPIGGVGHVGVVLDSAGDGWVHVGQYNIYDQGMYSEMDLKITSNLLFFQFH